MSILPVIAVVQEYNKNRESCFAYDKTYVLTNEDNKILERIASMIKLIDPKYGTSLQVCKHSGQVYVKCVFKHPDEFLKLPPVKGAINPNAMKV